VGAEGALETALVLMGSGPESATAREEREEGGRRSMSTKTKSRVDEAIRSYGYRAASHVET
jgi:DNA-binding LacI/PurR family transcriptional regulator